MQSDTPVSKKTFLCCDGHRTDPSGTDVLSKGQYLQGSHTNRQNWVPHQERRHVVQNRKGRLFQCWTTACTHNIGSFTGMGKGGRKIDLGDGSADCWCVHSCAGTMWVLTHGHPIKGLYMKLSCWSDRRFCAVSAHFIKIPAEIQLWNPTVCVSW